MQGLDLIRLPHLNHHRVENVEWVFNGFESLVDVPVLLSEEVEVVFGIEVFLELVDCVKKG